MKAAVLYKNDDIRYDDYKMPEVKPGTVKIRVKAAGICGSDIPRVLNNGAHFYPIVLGHEFSGYVVEIGEGVTAIRVGDTVTCAPLLPCMKCDDCINGNYSLCKHYSFIGSREQGSFADYIVVPELNVVKYNPSIPYTQAAMFEPSTVALHGLFCAGYKKGYDVAIIGCGTIGIFTLQWAKILGARSITALDVDDSRLELASKMGADKTINTRLSRYEDKVIEITNGRGFGFVFDATGNVDAISCAFDIVANKAVVCCIGTPSSDVRLSVSEWEKLNRKEFILTGSWMGYSFPFPGKEWSLTAQFFANGQLKFDPAFIYKIYPMNKVREAFNEFKNSSNVHGKIMLVND